MPVLDSISSAGAPAPASFPAAAGRSERGATTKRGHMTTNGGRIVYGDRTIMEVPKEFQARLTKIGGRNLYGEPNYRLVWGPARLGWIGGKFERVAGFGEAHVGLHLAPKYPYDQWVLERWFPAEYYGSKQAWRDSFTKRIDGVEVDVLGPYPSRGDYEEITSFAPIALTSKFADLLIRVIERSRAMRHADRREAILGRMEKEQKDWETYADDVLDDAFSPFPAAHVALSS